MKRTSSAGGGVSKFQCACNRYVIKYVYVRYVHICFTPIVVDASARTHTCTHTHSLTHTHHRTSTCHLTSVKIQWVSRPFWIYTLPVAPSPSKSRRPTSLPNTNSTIIPRIEVKYIILFMY